MSYDPRTIAFAAEVLYPPQQLRADLAQAVHNTLYRQPGRGYQNFQVAQDGIHLTNLPQAPGQVSSATFHWDRLVLREELREIVAVTPPKRLPDLRAIPVWLEVDNTRFNPCACYHVDAGWLKGAGFNPEKVKCVEICSAATFIKWMPSQPMMILHEMAHGYHDRVLTYQYAPIVKLYEQAKASGTYESVWRFKEGGAKERHYALTTPMEYFAESTEAYFGQNDFFPFVREELQRHDPDMCKLVAEIWGDAAE